MRSEAKIEEDVIKWAKKNSWLVLKLNNPWSKGWPDRLFISPLGHHIYIEFKKPGKKPRKLQEKRLSSLADNNCVVYWFDNVAGAIEALELYQ